MTPSSLAAVVTKRQSAITSLRPGATIIVLRVTIRLSACGVRYHTARRASLKHQERATRVGSCRADRALPAWLALVPVSGAPSSSGEPVRDGVVARYRFSVTHWPGQHPWTSTIMRFRQTKHRRFGPAGRKPWRGAGLRLASNLSDGATRSP